MPPVVALPHLKSQIEAAAAEGEEEEDNDVASVWDLPRPGVPASIWLPVPLPEVRRIDIPWDSRGREAGRAMREALKRARKAPGRHAGRVGIRLPVA